MGKTTTTKAGPVSADRLKSFIDRIEKLMEEAKAIRGDVKDVFSEAKGVGYDVKTMRKLIQIRAMDSADRAEQEALLDTYLYALGMDTGGLAREPTEEELEERAGRVVAEVDRCMELVEGGKLPKIAAIQELIGCSLGKASKLRGLVEERISRSEPKMRENEIGREMTADDLGDPLLVIDKPRGQFREKVRAIAASIKTPEPIEAMPVAEIEMPPIPQFLRRTA